MTKFLAKRDVAAMQQAVCEKVHQPELGSDMVQNMIRLMAANQGYQRPDLALKLAAEGRAMRDIKRGNMATCACYVVKYL